MLDFLRRKEKRRPGPQEVAVAATNFAVSAHAVAAAARAKPSQTQPLRDRNPAVPRPSNPRPSPPARKPRTSEKENSKRPEGEYRRWGKRNVPNGPEKKKKTRRRNHEPAVLVKAVTTDRRRSVKVPAPVAAPVKAPAPVAAPTPAMQKRGVKPDRTSQGRPHVPVQERPTHQRKPSGDRLKDYQLPTWPHTDLEALMRCGDVGAADIPVRRVAAAASRDDATRLKMVREGVAVSIVALLRHEEVSLDMMRNATFALAELAVLEACEDGLVAAGAVPMLIWLINQANNTDRSTLGSACRGLRNLLDGKETTAVQAAKYGCVEPLLAIADRRTGRAEEPEVVVEAAAAISNLSGHGSRFQGYVIKHGGIKSLTTLGMQTENEEALFHVVNILAEFAREARWHKSIVSANGLLTAFRALRMARDPEVVAEASRLVGNVAVTQKARSAVREAGGIVALVDRLARCTSFKEMTPAFDIVRALANVCLDGRAASDALTHKDVADILLNIFIAPNAHEKIIKTTFRALQILAIGRGTRRGKVLYAIGNQVKRAGAAGLPVKRLYDLRQAILEDSEAGNRDPGASAPESLERLSRASMRMINTGVVQHRQNQPLATKEYEEATQNLRVAGHMKKTNTPVSATGGNEDRVAKEQTPGLIGMNLGRKAIASPSAFFSTGRIVSVTRNCKPKQRSGLKQLADGRKAEVDEYDLPRGNEEPIAGDANWQARMLERQADGNMAKDFFEIGQVLGKGGYGSVFMAKDVRSGDIVAIKRFHNSGDVVDKKAIKEQNIWKGLHHPNVVEFKGSFVGDNGSLNLVVEFVDGLSLAEHLSQYRNFPETLVAEIARQVLSGLEYLHDNKVTHRDLKPANILVDNNSAVVKICDFGVSKSENVQTINPGQQHMVGTPWYIAPEMVEYRPYSTSVDIWSLGCSVLELATGRRPYHEMSAVQALFKMVEDQGPSIPHYLGPELQDFLKACWVWDPQERPSARDLLGHPFILMARKFSGSSKQSSTNLPSNLPEDPVCP